jgi:hypothetical protein
MSKAIVNYLHYAVLGTQVVITGHNGETRGTFEEKDVVGQVVLDVGAFPDAYQTAGGETKVLKAYGLCSLLQDRSSQAKGPADKFEYMQKEAARLQEEGALWSQTVEKEVKAKAPKVDSLFAQALAELKGVGVAAATIMVGKLSKEQVAALMANEKVKAKMAELRTAAEAADDMDLSDLFDL